jgi:putative ABC transport system ATP-binding protein
LLDTFSVRDNILLPLVLARVPLAEMELRLQPLAEHYNCKESYSNILMKFPVGKSSGPPSLVL